MGYRVLPYYLMVTISFKLSEDEALNLRTKARKAKMTMSHFLRNRIKGESSPLLAEITKRKCSFTGASIFTSKRGHLSPLTTATVRKMLAEFP